MLSLDIARIGGFQTLGNPVEAQFLWCGDTFVWILAGFSNISKCELLSVSVGISIPPELENVD